MRAIIPALLAALICLQAPPRLLAQDRLDSPATQEAVRGLVQGARTAVKPQDADDDGEEPGVVTNEEAGRPATKVADGVYRSSRPNDAALDHLYDLGVRTILNLESKSLHEDEERALERVRTARAAAGKPSWRIVSVSVPMSGIHPPAFAKVDDALDVLADPARRPILVHCKHGEDRTGVTVASFRVRVENRMSVDEAVKEAKSMNCCHLVMPWDSLRDFLGLLRWPR